MKQVRQKMADSSEAQPIERKARLEVEILALERTFLAWVRTSIAVITLGFVVARFSLWLRELAAKFNPEIPAHHVGASLWIGETMIGAGAILTLLAAWRYRMVARAIERGEVKADPKLVTFVTIMVTVLAGAIIIYMAFAAGKQ
jgi:putative membrane protein